MTITSLPTFVSPAGVSSAPPSSPLTLTQAANQISLSGLIIPAATDSLAGVLDAARATIIDNLEEVASSGAYGDLSGTPGANFGIQFNTGDLGDGTGVALTTGVKGWIIAPWAGTILGWTMVTDVSGSITVDIWKGTNAFPTVSNTICGGNPPALSSAQIGGGVAPGVAPTGWGATTFNPLDILVFNISATATIKRVSLLLTCAKS
jgi:hypothetical protein